MVSIKGSVNTTLVKGGDMLLVKYNGVEFIYDDGFSKWTSELLSIKKLYGTSRYVPS